MIYGSIFDKNISKLLLFIKRYHVILILGNDPLFRPVHYKDLAMFIYLLFERGIYNFSGTAIISGSETISYKSMCVRLARYYKIPFVTISLPANINIIIFKALSFLGIQSILPVTLEQIHRLTEAHLDVQQLHLCRISNADRLTFQDITRWVIYLA